jgi:methionine synthase II (cobalamin-independent)
MVNGLAIKALWQIKQLEKTGRRVILFMDEPSLTGFGSAFSAIQRHEVIQILQTIMGYLRDHSSALIGIHCCGNTDWPMLMEAGPDIINLDAFAYMDHFLLYPDEVEKYLESGGTVAWGIVPTADFTGTESVEGLFSKLEAGFDRIYEWGVDPHLVAERSLLTPACGMGTVPVQHAESGMDLLSQLAEKYQKMACT